MSETGETGKTGTTTTVDPGDGHWAESLVGDNTERLEALKGFESPDQFFESYDKAQDWRRQIAGDDDKFLSNLERFKEPAEFGKSWREKEQTIRAGKISEPLGEDATEEDVKAWRTENGIPLEAEGYFKDLPEGLVIGDDDKEIFADFAEAMHGKNVKPEVMHQAIEWYNSFEERTQAARLEMDEEHTAEANKELRETWGNDYRANMNLVQGLLGSTFGEEAKEQLLNGRYGDGRAFLNDPAVLKGLADIARKVNPVMQLANNGNDPSQSLNDEIAEIEKFMRDNRTEYLKDEGKQARLRQLYEIRIKQGQAA